MCTEPEGTFLYSTSPKSSNPEVRKWFDSVDSDGSGKISTRELQAALVNSQGKRFSDESCSLMVALFDKDGSGFIDFEEFEHLYSYINQWREVFKTFDKDRSGYIEEEELWQALNQMGYRLSRNFVKIVFECRVKDGGRRDRMTLDEFIVECVKIQRLTNAFKLRDTNMEGVISISFDNFIEIVLKQFLE